MVRARLGFEVGVRVGVGVGVRVSGHWGRVRGRVRVGAPGGGRRPARLTVLKVMGSWLGLG